MGTPKGSLGHLTTKERVVRVVVGPPRCEDRLGGHRRCGRREATQVEHRVVSSGSKGRTPWVIVFSVRVVPHNSPVQWSIFGGPDSTTCRGHPVWTFSTGRGKWVLLDPPVSPTYFTGTNGVTHPETSGYDRREGCCGSLFHSNRR